MPDHLLMDKPSQRGSVFFSIMAAVGMVAILGVGLTHFIQGPLKSATNVNRRNVAETQMQMSAKIAALTAAEQASNGDCDSDAFIEPVPYKDAGVTAHPTGGGLLPDTMGTQKRDPWSTDYGYCVWDHGPQINNAGCGGVAQKRLAGTNSASWETIAVISAGPDRAFQTTCNAWADVNADSKPDTPLVNKPSTSDDIVLTWTYAEAGASAAGLWQLKTNDPAKATISKDLEVTGGAEFSGALTLTQRGLVLPGDPGDDSITGACSLANDQQLRRNTSTAPPTLEICYESSPGVWTWEGVSGGGSDLWTKESNDKIHYDTANVGVGVADPVSKFEVNGNIAVGQDSTTCDSTTKGSFRFDSSDNQYRFCNGTNWIRFAEVQDTPNAPTAPTGYGYFVLSQSTWTGNLGGLTGADDKCLNELTTNTSWNGYNAALSAGQLTPSFVKAFLCYASDGPCNNLTPLTDYYFAVVGSPGLGGDFFTTDSNGRGPFNTEFWSAANRFGGSYAYWSIRSSTTCAGPNWETRGNGVCGWQHDDCDDWNSSSPGSIGAVGESANGGHQRYNGATRTCNTNQRLVCFVNPSGGGTACTGLSASFTNLTGQTPGASVTSSTETITFPGSCGGSLSVNISGTSAQMSIAGGPWVTSGTITSGQTLQLKMTATTDPGATRTATLLFGSPSVWRSWSVTSSTVGTPMFITRNGYAGNSIGGLAGADAICQAEAVLAGWAGTYKAILSDSTTNAKDRLTITYPVYNAVNNTRIAGANLWGGIETTVRDRAGGNSTTPWGRTWTGTLISGNKNSNNCSNWSSATNGDLGWAQQTDTNWLQHMTDSCTNAYALYCIKQ